VKVVVSRRLTPPLLHYTSTTSILYLHHSYTIPPPLLHYASTTSTLYFHHFYTIPPPLLHYASTTSTLYFHHFYTMLPPLLHYTSTSFEVLQPYINRDYLGKKYSKIINCYNYFYFGKLQYTMIFQNFFNSRSRQATVVNHWLSITHPLVP